MRVGGLGVLGTAFKYLASQRSHQGRFTRGVGVLLVWCEHGYGARLLACLLAYGAPRSQTLFALLMMAIRVPLIFTDSQVTVNFQATSPFWTNHVPYLDQIRNPPKGHINPPKGGGTPFWCGVS